MPAYLRRLQGKRELVRKIIERVDRTEPEPLVERKNLHLELNPGYLRAAVVNRKLQGRATVLDRLDLVGVEVVKVRDRPAKGRGSTRIPGAELKADLLHYLVLRQKRVAHKGLGPESVGIPLGYTGHPEAAADIRKKIDDGIVQVVPGRYRGRGPGQFPG